MKAPTGLIVPYEPELRQKVIDVWERSVRTTHDFLDPDDVDLYKEIVQTIDFEAFPMYCSVVGEHVAGFIGVAGRKVEMLFLAPPFMGKGLGSKLLRYAIDELGADEVEVNEQNKDAVAFYQKHGFVTCSRSERDGQGRPYPILVMRLQSSQNAF